MPFLTSLREISSPELFGYVLSITKYMLSAGATAVLPSVVSKYGEFTVFSTTEKAL